MQTDKSLGEKITFCHSSNNALRTVCQFLFTEVLSPVKQCFENLRTVSQFLFTEVLSLVKQCFENDMSVFVH